MIVGESGQIQATIHSICVVISGLVEGDVHATQEIVLHKTAVVNGNLEAPAIMMEEGAQLNGNVRMGAPAKTASDSTVKAAPNASANTNAGQQSGANGTSTGKGSNN